MASVSGPDGGAPQDRSALTPAARARAFRLLFLCLMTSGIGNSILFAVLPPLAREIAMGEISVGVIYTISAVLFAVMSQVWGAASDRFGRKPIILVGLTGYAFSTIAFAFVVEVAREAVLGVSATVMLLMVARALFGGLGSAAGPAAQAYVADRTPPRERTEAIAALTAAFGFGAALGPGLAGWLAPRIGLVAPLYVTALMAIAGAIAVAFLLPEHRPPSRRLGAKGLRLGLIGDPRLRAILFAGCAIWIVQATTLQTVNFYVMDRVGVGGEWATQLAGAALTASALAMLAAQLGVIRVLRPRPRPALIAGSAIGLAGASMMALSTAYGEIVFANTLLGFAMGLSRPGMAAAASLAVEPEEQGAAAGLAAGAAGVGFLLAPLTGLALYKVAGIWTPYALNAVICAAVAALALFHPAIARASDRAKSEAG